MPTNMLKADRLRAAQWLNLLQRVFPAFGSSFYAKGKLVKRDVPPNPSSVVLDIIRQCSFGCSFCFASETQARGDFTSLETLETLFEELSGIGKVTLIGGEPFEHPQLVQIIQALWPHVGEEIEIFTNGAACPADIAAAEAWLVPLLSREGKRLRMTLACDPWHQQRHGEVRFSDLIDSWLELERRGWMRAMFNVTDARIYSENYIDVPTIRSVITELSPRLWAHFEKLADRLHVDEGFYLNPLIVQGRQTAAPGAECLRATDFRFHPEVVVSEREGALHLFCSLNAMWLDPPPQICVAGPLGDDFAELIATHIVAPQLQAGRLPWLLPAMRALLLDGAASRETNLDDARTQLHAAPHPLGDEILQAVSRNDIDRAAGLVQAAAIFARFQALVEAPQEFVDELADYLHGAAFSEPLIHAPLELSGRSDGDMIRLAPVTRLIERRCEAGQGARLFVGPQTLWAELAALPDAAPVVVTDRQSVGRVPEPNRTQVPLVQTALDTGFVRWPDDSARYAVRVLARAEDGALDIALAGLKVAGGVADARQRNQAVQRLLDYWLLVYGPAFGALLENLPGDGHPYAALLETAESDWKSRYATLQTLGLPQNLKQALDWAAFDPGRNRLPLDNPAFLRLLIDHARYPGYSEDDVERFKESMRFWLEQLQDS